MPLHLTKVAFGATGLEHLAERLLARAGAGPVFLTTRYLPKRHEEIIGGGSLFWIIKHQLVARSPILHFGDADGGPEGRKVAIHIDPKLVLTHARPKRAHQGWRYLEDADAPVDLGVDEMAGDMMPAALMGKLSGLGLI